MKLNLSSSPHIKCGESTRSIMYDVLLALLPATAFGIYRFGIYSLLILIVSIGFAVLSEYMYQNLTNQPIRIQDGSAIVTGLLIGLNMPPSVPLWIPALGSMFAIVVIKQFFGGLGKNFMNPAMGARVFLLISFTGIMSDYAVDVATSATPLTNMLTGVKPDLAAMFVGLRTGSIGEISIIALLIGGIYLLIKKVISWEIPVVYIGSFTIFLMIFGECSPSYILAHLYGGGLMLGAFFMATDYVTSPVTKNGKIVFGLVLGILTGIFRIFGASAEGVSYAIIIGNLLVPLIEKVTMPKAFGLEHVKKEKPEKVVVESVKTVEKTPISKGTYKAAMNLTLITLVAGLLLGAVYQITKGPIEQANMDSETEAFKSVCPQAVSFGDGKAIMDVADQFNGTYGDVTINNAYTCLDDTGNINGYVVVVTSTEGFGGEIQSGIGFDKDGKVTGIEFLTINETAGLGMRATEDEFRNQYVGKDVEEFVVSENIDAISGATITSKAVTASVNTAMSAVKAVME